MDDKQLLEIRLSGAGILPDTVRAGEIADILNSVEDMISSVALQRYPRLTRDDLLVGLVGIASGSIHLQFSSKLPDIVVPAFHAVAESIETNQYRNLPIGSVRALQTIASFVRRRDCLAEFVIPNGDDQVVAEISPQTEITPVPFLTGVTTLYGMIIRVGGRTPKAMLETVDGQTVYCDLRRELARELGSKLYQWVAIEGVAKWNSETLNLEEFRIDAVFDYERRSIHESFVELSELTSRYYLDIEDVAGYVAQLRSGRQGDY